MFRGVREFFFTFFFTRRFRQGCFMDDRAVTDYAQARAHMVAGQIHPQGVVDPHILEAFAAVPREMFVPEGRAAAAYCDEGAQLDFEGVEGRFLMEPPLVARLIQAAAPESGDVVLDVGGASGYVSAVFAPLVTTVVMLESDVVLLRKAEENWRRLDICNAAAIDGDLKEGCPRNAPYDLIFLNGSVAAVPMEIKEQLSGRGRLVAVVADTQTGKGQAVLIRRTETGGFTEQVLFDAWTPFLPGFTPRTPFVF